jgi:hypothetical protein
MVGFKLKKILRVIKKRVFNIHLGAIIANFIEDIFIFGGLFFIVFATFMISKIIGFYVLGVCLLGLGIWFTRNPIRKG